VAVIPVPPPAVATFAAKPTLASESTATERSMSFFIEEFLSYC
jgi:hypothetical protein